MFRSGNWFLGLVAVLLGAPQQACSFAPSLAVVPALGRPSAATTTTATMLPYFPLRVASPRLGSSVVRSQSLSEGGEEEKKSLWHKLKDGAKMDKKKLGSLGLYALLSYGFVSNASYAVGIGAAWYIASMQSGLSPLAPGQWKAFLAVWASVFVFNNIIRPARFALAVALAPAFDRFIAFIQKKTGKNKTVATGICVFLVNVCGTITLMSSGILIASLASGVPIWAV